MPTLDTEFVSTNINEASLPSRVVADTGQMAKLLSSFHQSLEEVTLIAHPEQDATGAAAQRTVQLRSFLDAKTGRGGEEGGQQCHGGGCTWHVSVRGC